MPSNSLALEIIYGVGSNNVLLCGKWMVLSCVGRGWY